MLANYLFTGRTLQWNAALEKQVAGLTVEQVNAALRKYINPAKISIFKAGDFAGAAAKAAAAKQ